MNLTFNRSLAGPNGVKFKQFEWSLHVPAQIRLAFGLSSIMYIMLLNLKGFQIDTVCYY